MTPKTASLAAKTKVTVTYPADAPFMDYTTWTPQAYTVGDKPDTDSPTVSPYVKAQTETSFWFDTTGLFGDPVGFAPGDYDIYIVSGDSSQYTFLGKLTITA